MISHMRELEDEFSGRQSTYYLRNYHKDSNRGILEVIDGTNEQKHRASCLKAKLKRKSKRKQK